MTAPSEPISTSAIVYAAGTALLALVAFFGRHTLVGLLDGIKGLREEMAALRQTIASHGEAMAGLRATVDAQGRQLEDHERRLNAHGRQLGELAGGLRGARRHG